MAENVQLNPGTGGDVAAADEIDGVKYQRIKLALGADGVNAGDVADTNPMPVRDAVQDMILQTLREILARQPMPSPGESQRVIVGESATLPVSGTVAVSTATTVTTVGTVTTMSQIAARPADTVVFDLMRVASDGLNQYVVVT
jgi:hypothetical protein